MRSKHNLLEIDVDEEFNKIIKTEVRPLLNETGNLIKEKKSKFYSDYLDEDKGDFNLINDS